MINDANLIDNHVDKVDLCHFLSMNFNLTAIKTTTDSCPDPFWPEPVQNSVNSFRIIPGAFDNHFENSIRVST